MNDPMSLGVLTRLVHGDLADAVFAETSRVECNRRPLPVRVSVDLLRAGRTAFSLCCRNTRRLIVTMRLLFGGPLSCVPFDPSPLMKSRCGGPSELAIVQNRGNLFSGHGGATAS